MRNILKTNTSEKQRNLLFISYYFPPIHVNAIIRIKNFFEAFIESGYQVFVITGKFPPGMPRDTSQQVYNPRVTYIPIIGIRNYLTNQILKNHTLPPKWKKKPLISFLLSIRNRIPYSIIFGDGGLCYLLGSYLKGLGWIKKYKITHIYSSFSPFTDHFIAYLLKYRYPHLHWTADFRDLPFDMKNPSKWNQAVFQYFFKKIISQATEIITVSEGLAKALRYYHNQINIYSGCISNDRINLPTKRPITFNLNYTGSIYPDFQEIFPLISVVMELIEEKIIEVNDIKWTYCGIHPSIFKEWLVPYFNNEQLEIQDLLSLKESQQRQQEAGINFLLTWCTDNEEGILTTKLFEYLEAGRPILVWTKGKYEAEMAKILALCQVGGYFQEKREKEMKGWISDKYLRWKKQSWTSFDQIKLREVYGKDQRNSLIKKVSEKTPTRKNT